MAMSFNPFNIKQRKYSWVTACDHIYRSYVHRLQNPETERLHPIMKRERGLKNNTRLDS